MNAACWSICAYSFWSWERDSHDMSPILFGTGKPERKCWFYFTENELAPGAVRCGNYKAVFNLRGDDGAKTGGLGANSRCMFS